jgi:hypothetical protein
MGLILQCDGISGIDENCNGISGIDENCNGIYIRNCPKLETRKNLLHCVSCLFDRLSLDSGSVPYFTK